MSTLSLPAPVPDHGTESSVSGRIPTLDGWRGIAILLVLISHFGPGMGHFSAGIDDRLRSLGGRGVGIFFVLSGYLITTLLTREKALGGTINLRRFYLRRFFRLMPCAWCYLAVIICLTIRMHPKPFTWLDILGCIFFFRNFLDPVGTHAITGHFWSLSIEEQFYLVWPSVLLLGRRSALWLAIGSSCLVVAWRSPLFSANHHALLTATQYRADALLVGCAMGLMIPTLRPYLRSWMALPLLVFLAASIYQSLAFIPLHESIAVALLLGVTTSCPGLPVLNWKPLVSLGTISYSVYVWQQPLWLLASGGHIAVSFVSFSILVVISILSYSLIEEPIKRIGRLASERIAVHAKPDSCTKVQSIAPVEVA